MDKAIITAGVRKVILRFTIVFFIVLLVLTFFSKTIDNMLLPEVTVYTPADKTITNSCRIQADLAYINTKKAYPDFSCFIEGVLVEKGQIIEESMPIAQLRGSDVEQARNEYAKQILSLEITVSQLEEALKHWMPKAQKEMMQRQFEIAKTDLGIIEKEFDLYSSKIDGEYRLLAGVSGEVLSVSMRSQSYIDSTNELFEYAGEETRMVMQWRMNPQQASSYDLNSRLYVEYTYYETDSEGNRYEKTATKNYQITSIELDQENGGHVYKALVGVDDEALFLASPELSFNLSTPPVSLKQAVPRSAVHTEGDGQHFIFILREDYITKELTVAKTHVGIGLEHGMYCMVSHEFGYDESIVLTYSKPLEHNMRVKMK